MQQLSGQYLFSATDVVAFLECEHLTELDLQAAQQPQWRAQRSRVDESAELIARKGTEHELAHLARLRAQRLRVVDVAEGGGGIDDKVARTRDAMASGADVVFQATMRDGPWIGHADFLIKVEGLSSTFGTWSYEVADTKLARSPKAKFLVQLAFYSYLLGLAQGVEPRQMHVVLGDKREAAFRCADYLHYFRALRTRYSQRVEQLVAGSAPPVYPVPCAHCDLCHWRERCEARRVADDHLSQVANISRVQKNRLQAHGVSTLAQLAARSAADPVAGMHKDTFARLQSQAALQERARRTGQREVLVLPPDPDGQRGFYRMPAPDDGDLFFDMEGDPLEVGGLEYLFGVWFLDAGQWTFRGFWAHDRAQERVAFEQLVDFVVARRLRHPAAHVYHYASYEETALKRLASFHATREVEVDQFLRQGVLVDLYKVVREGIRISEPSYSIKYVEHFYRPGRAGDVQNAGASIVFYERWRETHDPQLLHDIEAYNRDDVESTWQLRDWLLTMRPAGIPWWTRSEPGGAVGVPPNAEPSRTEKAELRLVPYRERLVDGLPADRSLCTPDQQVGELTWQLLDFHRRADKPAYWALYARKELDEDVLMDDPECLAGLTLDPDNPPVLVKRSTVYTYRVPAQDTKLASGDSCTRCDTAQDLGKLVFDADAGRLQLKRGPKKDALPERLSIGPSGPISASVLVDAVYRFADSLLSGDNRYPALQQFLRRDPPRLVGRADGEPIVTTGQTLLSGALEAAQALDQSYLYVQGPPGSGKTYTGARMIVRLLEAGKRVGIMSNSHKAIHNLLEGVMEVLAERRIDVRVVKKAAPGRDETEFHCAHGAVANVYSNVNVWADNCQLIAGTGWLFADERGDQQLDHLFVDEAGQVALANLVAAGTCARNIVLLGDQMQLSQPVQGVHPGRSGESALDNLLDGAATIAPERGIFLAKTFRMHPLVCSFISDAVYDGRLEPEEGNVNRTLRLDSGAHSLLRPAGIVHAAIEHKGCSQGSAQEAALVAELVASALQQGYTDKSGVEHPMTLDNILVVAPYNVQVNLLRRALPEGARVGTVDKLQGQEAELVIVSMTTSSEDDLPRNIEFLYSRNRLNVAISRARCLAIVIANPALMAIHCNTPEQMALVNTLCWMAEVGRERPQEAHDKSTVGEYPEMDRHSSQLPRPGREQVHIRPAILAVEDRR